VTEAQFKELMDKFDALTAAVMDVEDAVGRVEKEIADMRESGLSVWRAGT